MRSTLTALSCLVAAVALALACSAPAPREREAGAQPAVKNAAWEYKTIPVSTVVGQGDQSHEVEALFNRMSGENWEYLHTDRGVCFVFRRPKK